MLGLDRLSVAGSLVTGATQVIASGFTYNKFYPIANQNGDGSAISITSVVASTNWALTSEPDADADYVKTNVGWVYGIIILNSTTVTTTSQTITITYDYTPSSYTLDGYNIKKDTIPYGVFKFVSCKNPTSETVGVQDTIYFWKYVLSGDLIEDYIDRADNQEFAGSECSLVGVFGGWYLKKKATGVAL